MLCNTSAEILKVLIEKEDEYITAKKISDIIGISQRSVNTYMKEVAIFCSTKSLKLEKKQGHGSRLHLGQKKEQIVQYLSDYNMPIYTKEQRISYIIQILTRCVEPYTIALCADDLFVSKTTITNDIKDANKWLKGYDVKIETIVGKGIVIVGDEFQLRKILVLKNIQNHMGYKEKPLEPLDYRLSEETYLRLVYYYSLPIVKKAIESINWLESRISSSFNEYTFVMLVEYISNQVKRIKKGIYLAPSKFIQSDVIREVLAWARDLSEHLARSFDVEFTGEETIYLYYILLGSEFQTNKLNLYKKCILEKPIPIKYVSRALIHYIEWVVGLNFSDDILLLRSLNTFLNASFYRTSFSFEIINPYIKEIKKTYPAIFSACFTANTFYTKWTGKEASEQEIAYMCMLFAGAVVIEKKEINTVMISSEGAGRSEIISRKVEACVPQVNIITTLSAQNYKEPLENLQYSLILTTIPSLNLEDCADEKCVLISPIVNNKDIKKIRQACNEEYNARQSEKGISFQSLLSNDYIFLEDDVMTKDAVLKKVCQKLRAEGYVKKGFYEDILRREKIGSSALGDGIAIPHGMANLVNKPVVSIVRLKNKTEWDNEFVDVIFLLALNFKNIKSTRAFFKKFYEMTLEKDIVQWIRNAQTKSEIQEIIKTM